MLPDMTPRGVSIRIFLVDGRPEGLRLVEKSNWTGIGIVCARSDYVNARGRDEWTRPGIYILSGPSTAGTLSSRIYVGEADELRARIDTHAKSKDFWTMAVAFTSKDANLNKAHARYLESRLISLAQQANRSELDNGTVPPIPHLSEPDVADMEAFLEDIRLILPLVGVHAFEIPAKVSAGQADLLYLRGPGGVEASGSDRADGFVVYEGSTGRVDEVPSIPYWVSKLRMQLQQGGIILEPGDGVLRVKSTYVFDSASSAAGALLGRSANGRVEWKDKAGRTLKQIQEAQLP